MKKKIDLTQGNILQKLLIVAIPTLLGSIVQMTYNLTDMFWVSRVYLIGQVPEEAVAAVGTAGYLPWFGFGLILLAKIGTSVTVSQAAGRDDMEEVKRYGNNGIVLMIILALLYSGVGFFGRYLYISIFNIENANTYQYAIEYISIIAGFGFVYFLVHIFNSIYDGLGKTINTLLVTATGLVLNIVLDPIFILDEVDVFGLFTINGLGMGVRGAAIATMLAHGVIVLIYLIIYQTKYKPFKIQLFAYFNKETMKRILSIGIHPAVQSMIFTMISIVLGVFIISFGDIAMSVQRVGSQIEALAWMVASGFQVALASYVGQNFGAGKMDRIRDGYYTALKLLVPYGIIINIVLFVFAEQAFDIFFDNPETLRVGKIYLEILSFSQLFMIIELGTAGAFNGLGKTYIPSWVGISGNALRIPFSALLMGVVGFAGIWWVISISSVLKGTVLTAWFLYYLYKLKTQNGFSFEN